MVASTSTTPEHFPLALLLLAGVGGLALYASMSHNKPSKHKHAKHHPPMTTEELERTFPGLKHHLEPMIPKTHANSQKKFDFHGVNIPLDHYSFGRDFDPITVPNFKKKRITLSDMGWNVPDFENIPVYDNSQTQNLPYVPHYKKFQDNVSLGRVANDTYQDLNIDDARGDGFSGLARSYNVNTMGPPGLMGRPPPMPIPINQQQSGNMFSEFGPDAPQPVNSTDPMFDASVSDTDSIPALVVDPDGPGPNPHVVSMQNQLLKMIIANTTSVNTILSNIDTIKHALRQYGHKLRQAYEQVQIGNLAPPQFQQFMMQVVSDVANELQLPLNPQFVQQLNSSPYQPVSPFM